MAKRVALCIGINKYKHSPQNNLRWARADAESMASILADTSRGGFDICAALYDDDGTKAQVLDSFNQLLLDPDRDPDDIALVYFSGHGCLDRQGDICLIPHDFRYHTDASLDFSSTIHVRELEPGLANTNVTNVILMVDSCHSGAFGRIATRIQIPESFNLFIMGAARQSEVAREDPQVQHGIFTECLLRALSGRPNLGEWITVGQIISFIALEIKKFPSSQIMEVTSHAVDPNIPFARNPIYSLESQKFTEEVQKIFELRGYRLRPVPEAQTHPNFFIAPEASGFRERVEGVLCLDNTVADVTKNRLDQFLEMIRHGRHAEELDGGMLVTRNAIPSTLYANIKGSRIADWKTKDDLMRTLIDFDEYLISLIEGYIGNTEGKDPENTLEPALGKYYVDLNAESRNLHKKAWRGWLDEYIYDWLAATGRQRLALLGEYGTGKTTFCRKLAHDLAKTYREALDKTGHRIPVIINLREFPRGPADLEALIISHLVRRCGVTNPSFRAFQAMNDAGLLLLIFDGFDEMAMWADKYVIHRNLMQIERLAASARSKVLLTSRPEYFLTRKEEEEALQLSGQGYERLTLLLWEPGQIETFLQSNYSGTVRHTSNHS